MRGYFLLFIVLVLMETTVSFASAETLCLQGFGGGAYDFRAPLTIRQNGEEKIRINHAHYHEESLQWPIYSSLRAGWWQDKQAWELELIHQKLYLKSKPSEVEDFGISHGFNLLTLNHAWKHPWFVWRVGLGMVITHPENTVRGRTFGESGGIIDGYYLSGATGQIGLEKRFYVLKWLFFSIEGKATLSWARVPVNGGHAELWNPALHGLVGMSFDFSLRRKKVGP